MPKAKKVGLKFFGPRKSGHAFVTSKKSGRAVSRAGVFVRRRPKKK